MRDVVIASAVRDVYKRQQLERYGTELVSSPMKLIFEAEQRF